MSKDKRQMKSASRLYAVQALFQMEAAEHGVDEILAEFETHRFGAVYDEGEYTEGHLGLFRQLVRTAQSEQSQIDQMTDRALVAKWPIDRIDPTLRAIFRVAGAELLGDTPPKVVLSEFVDIAHAFFSRRTREKVRQRGFGPHGARSSTECIFTGKLEHTFLITRHWGN